MVSDEQVRVLRKKRMAGEEMEAASAAAGMSVRTAQKWQKGIIPSATKGERAWRTREDPFAAVLEEEVVPLLAGVDGDRLEAKTVFEDLNRKRKVEERFGEGQLRTLQRRIRE